MKKFLLTLLGVLMTLPSFARDFQYTYQGQTLTYTVVDEEAKTVRTKAGSYNGTATPGNTVSGVLNLPEKVYDDGESYTLVAIGSNGFPTTDITGIIIPSSVETIGSYAFQDCSNLTGNVIIPPTVKTMERGAFQRDEIRVAYPNTISNGGANTNAELISYDPVTSVIEDECLFDQLKENLIMASCALSGEFSIPNSVTYISWYAFSGCSRLTSVTIPNSVTSISVSAFDGCSGLTEVIIPPSVTSIGNYAFNNCSGLTSVTIGNSVTSIGDYAFRNCSGLTEVIIPNSVTYISRYAFEGCTGLKKSAYPNTLLNPFNYGWCISYNPNGAIIEDGWIYGPEKKEIRFAPYTLEGEYNISDSVTSIDYEAFIGCSGLTEVIIPPSVTSIGASAFYSCIGLKKSAYPNTLRNPFDSGWCISYNPKGAIIEDGWIYGPEKKEIRFAPYTLEGEYTIPETVTSIGGSAFKGCTGLTEVIIGNSVETIGSEAFHSCSGLTSVTIPNSVTSISSGAFNVCI